jgi:hypothetical protein
MAVSRTDPSAVLWLLVWICGTMWARMCGIGDTNFPEKRLL